MSDRNLIRAFWNCGDSEIIDFAMMRARLNKREKQALTLVLDDCMTQEQASEYMDISTRCFQKLWYSATDKVMSIPWVLAFAKELNH